MRSRFARTPEYRIAIMIIDCHGHYTTEPKALHDFRKRQLEAAATHGPTPTLESLRISDDELRESVVDKQMRLQRERGTDVTIFSPRASGMGHHAGDARTSETWSRASNDLIGRICRLFPDNFVPVGQLPQSPGVMPANCIGEVRRCVEELGFIGFNLNPDPSGGHWSTPPLTDRWWYPLYEKLVEYDVPAMIHVSASCNANFHTTGAHYINADTTAFMQLLASNLFADFPTLRLVIPHGGGAIPYHWGRYRGLAITLGRPSLAEVMGDNIFFDTCVYHQPGMDLMTKVVPVDNVLFASEMLGAVPHADPDTGHAFDDTKRYVDALPLSGTDKHKIFEGNGRRVYPRINAYLDRIGKGRTAAR